MRTILPLLVLAVFLTSPAQAQEASKFYGLSTQGTTAKLKSGERGKVVFAFEMKGGAHLSEEAPMKILLSSPEAQLEKTRLSRSDGTPGRTPATTNFEVGFTPTAQGRVTIDAQLTFFVCTENRCLREVASLKLPIDVM